MDILIFVLIIVGAVNMVVNIIGFVLFMVRMRDVISSGRKRDTVWQIIALVLLVFFLLGYIFVAIFADPHIVTSLILFFGSVFVTIVLILLSRLIETAKERSIEIAEILIGVIDARDPNLQGHSVHVKNLAMVFYKYLPAHTKFLINPVSLEYAALMHDIGKLGVPEAILNKPGKLDDKEWEVMKKHPEIAVKLLKHLKSFNSITDWVLCHHERADGQGYYKRPASTLPIAAKILAIVDAYSAITMRRSYKAPRTHEEAIEIIKEGMNKQFDKSLAEIFITIPKEELEKCIPDAVKY